MKNNIEQEKIDSIDAAFEYIDLEIKIAKDIVDAAVNEAIPNIKTLPTNASFELEDVLSNDTVAFLEREGLTSRFEGTLLKSYFGSDINGSSIDIRASGFVVGTL